VPPILAVDHANDPLVRKSQLTPAASAHLDFVRGLAAIAVLVSHWRNFFLLDWQSVPHHTPLLALLYFVTGFGHSAVIIFFVLSGYLIGGHVVQACRRNRWSWKRYALDRLTRLGIVLIPALLFCLALDSAGIHLFHGDWLYSGSGHIAEMQVPVTDSPKVLLGNLLFLQTIRVPVFGSDFPLWSLANEFWYYVLFPLLALPWFFKRGGLRTLCAALFLVIVVALPFAIAVSFLIWLLGTAVFLFPPARRLTGWQTAWAGGISGLAMLAVLLGDRARHLSSAWSDNLLAVAFAALLYALVHGSLPASKLYSRVAKFISASSYTVYLAHFPFFACCLAAIGVRWLPDAWHLTLAAGLLIAGYGYAVGFAALFEAQTGRVKKWIGPRLGIG